MPYCGVVGTDHPTSPGYSGYAPPRFITSHPQYTAISHLLNCKEKYAARFPQGKQRNISSLLSLAPPPTTISNPKSHLAKIYCPILLLLYSLHTSISHAQNTGHIYTTAEDTDDGSFTFPRAFPLSFREGSSINISWHTPQISINLFYYQRGNVANSIQLASNQAVPWFQWQMSANEDNLTEPYVFRGVDAGGTNNEVKIGGFWSASYYITMFGAGASKVASSFASSSTSSSLVSLPPSRTRDVIATTQSRVLASKEASHAPLQSPVAPGAGGLEKKTVVGVAVGVSVAVLLVVVGGLAYAWYRWQWPKVVEKTAVVAPAQQEHIKDNGLTFVAHKIYVSPAEMEGSKTVFELPVKSSQRVEDRRDNGVGKNE